MSHLTDTQRGKRTFPSEATHSSEKKDSTLKKGGKPVWPEEKVLVEYDNSIYWHP